MLQRVALPASFLMGVLSAPPALPSSFQRGDASADGRFDITDPIFILGHLFRGDPAPPCLDAADSNDDGQLDISDPVLSLMSLFAAFLPLPPPHPRCGEDPTADDLGCIEFAPCLADRDEIVAIRRVNAGVEIELFSTHPFPVRALPPVLCIGSQSIFSSRPGEDGRLDTLIFTLTSGEFDATRSGEQVTVQHGGCSEDLEGQRPYWDLWIFGSLDRGLLEG